MDEDAVALLGLETDFVGSPAARRPTAWAEKPAAEFFACLAEEAGCDSGRIAHVGDRLDNDVLAALSAGMRAVLIRRGPWAASQSTWPEGALAEHRIDSLTELGATLGLSW